MSFSVNVDPTNPGQFFACCGLMELADRLWPGAEGWFAKDDRAFHIAAVGGSLAELVREMSTATLTQLDGEDPTGSPLGVGAPFGSLRLDWWQDNRAGGKELKVWAGRMESLRIAAGMQYALPAAKFSSPDLFDIGLVVYEPNDSEKKVEPFYFDARRGPNAHSRDVGFSPNDLSLTTTAFPAVEFLCLVGLQRCLPAKTDEPRIYDYFTWTEPFAPVLLPAAVSGLLPHAGARGYRFENWFRTGQRKHKAFRSAIPLSSKVTK